MDPVPCLEVDAPPELPDDDGAPGVLLTALPMLGGLGSLLVLTTASDRPGAMARAVVAAVTMLGVTLAVVAAQLDRQHRRRRASLARARIAYRHHLAGLRTRARALSATQRAALEERFPPPDLLAQVIGRPCGDDDPTFLHVRVGVGEVPLRAEWRLAPEPPDRVDPVCADARRRLIGVQGAIDEAPLVLDLRTAGRLQVLADPERARSWARALICSAAAAHAPADLAVELVAAPGHGATQHWEWLKWLPHHRSGGGSVGGSTSHRLIVVDGASLPPPTPGATIVRLGAPHPDDVAEATVRLDDRHDTCGPASAEALARRIAARDLAPRLLAAASSRSAPSARPADRLRVLLGTGPDDVPVLLDLKEAAEEGVGPHGLVVGATGSGKSELLRTLVLGLAATHPSEHLHLVLVDFKGGATFAGLAALPHVAALITNLADDLALVERMEDVLGGELERRQEVLRAAGAGSVRELRDRDPALLPDLVVVVDEFSELLAARPSFAELFAAIGRLGRSLGIHLLLATQRLEEGRLRGLEAHLSYRIALRTFSAQESRAAIGVPDAADLPAAPGRGLLRTGPHPPLRFRAHVVGVPAPAPADTAAITPFRRAGVDPPAAESAATDGPTVLETTVASLQGRGRPARRLWTPPLDDSPDLRDLIDDLAVTDELGLHSPALRAAGGLRVPVGSIDRPREQRRDALVLDLSGSGGHVAVVGGPRSGVTTALRTIATALTLGSTPHELQLLVVTGEPPQAWSSPHLAGVTGSDDPDGVRRLLAAAQDVVVERARLLRDAAVPDLASFRRRLRAGGPIPLDPGSAAPGWGEVVVVLDDWSALRSSLPDLEQSVHDLAARGLGLGVHLLLGARRWSDLRPALRDLLGSRVELRLGDPVESVVDRRRAAGVPEGRPGRGLTASGHHLLLARPTITDLPAAEALTRAWRGAPGPRVRVLPDRVDLAEVRAETPDTIGLLLGWEQRSWTAAAWSPEHDPHLLALGDARSGRTALLRTIAHEIARAHCPQEARIVVLDPRRSLLGELPVDHLLHHLTGEDAGPALHDLARYLRARLPPPDVSPAALRARSWWCGAEVFVLVDDHDLLPGAGSPLLPLAPLLARAGDVGLHVVLARRAFGTGRAWHDPVLGALRDLGGPALLLAGSPEEGPLIGGLRPAPAPPGRARLLRRDGVREVQVAWSPPAA